MWSVTVRLLMDDFDIPPIPVIIRTRVCQFVLDWVGALSVPAIWHVVRFARRTLQL